MKTRIGNYAALIAACTAVAAICIFVAPIGKSADKTSKEGTKTTKIIDDFSRDDQLSALGGPWKFVADSVHFGKSHGKMTREKIDGRTALCMRGTVDLTFGNGFIQSGLDLKNGKVFYDASAYKGIELEVEGNGETYQLLLKDSHTKYHWQLYVADFKAGKKWEMVKIAFGDFKPYKMKRGPDSKELAELAIVASGKKYDADVCVSKIAFY
jgi:hypothetical protein